MRKTQLPNLAIGSWPAKFSSNAFRRRHSRTKTSTQGGLEPPSVASAKSSQTLDSSALSIRRLGPCQMQMLATKMDSASS